MNNTKNVQDSQELTKIIDWYKDKFSASQKRSKKNNNPYAEKIFTVLNKDMHITIADKIVQKLKSLDLKANELNDLANKLIEISAKKITDLMQSMKLDSKFDLDLNLEKHPQRKRNKNNDTFIDDEIKFQNTTDLFERERLWIKSLVFTQFKLQF